MNTNFESSEHLNEYVIADQGSLVGRVYFLVLPGGDEIMLKGSSDEMGSEFKIYGDTAAAEASARKEVAERFGEKLARAATFQFIQGNRR